ncbi:hypothetical protein [Saccharothrix sp. HUAS TT10]|uniref:hypothetical protein n=1 Tax=Saccharothrix sp. HUAS TT10 TaxID=3447450 RepID=UPI003F70CDEC
MAFVEDEQSVGGFAPDGADEPFGAGVGSWTPWWDPGDLDARVGEDCVERGGELTGPASDENRKSSARSPRSITKNT